MWLASLNFLEQRKQQQEQNINEEMNLYILRMVIELAPLWFILLLGIYAVIWIAYGVITLQDNPNSARELEEQVKQAKEEMKRRGIIQ